MSHNRLYPAFCVECGISKGNRRKERLFSLCTDCAYKSASATKIKKSQEKATEEGFSLDRKWITRPNGKETLVFRMFCPTCNKDKGYLTKSSRGNDCFQCSANKSGLKNRGNIPTPNKGKPASEISKIKTSCTKQGIAIEDFNGFITSKNQKLRCEPRMRDLKQKCYKRDNYSCNCCSKRGGRLNAHHLNSWKKFPEERYELDNLVTLCEKCHIVYHNIYGKGSRFKDPNIKEQYLSFKEKYSGKENEENRQAAEEFQKEVQVAKATKKPKTTKSN